MEPPRLDAQSIFSEFDQVERRALIATFVQCPQAALIPRSQLFLLWFSDLERLTQLLNPKDDFLTARMSFLSPFVTETIPHFHFLCLTFFSPKMPKSWKEELRKFFSRKTADSTDHDDPSSDVAGICKLAQAMLNQQV
jgi:hypothetical protein